MKQGFDGKAADALISAQDLAPNDIFNYVVTQLNGQAVAAAADEKAKAIRQLVILLAIVGGLFFVDSIVYCSVLFGVLKRLGQLKTVSDRWRWRTLKGFGSISRVMMRLARSATA